VFENVPNWLTEKVKGLGPIIDPANREQIYYATSVWTIAYYLRKNVQAEDVEVFFDPPGEEPVNEFDALWHAHVNRVILVAETLFLLRSSPGFSELRKRLEERELRPSFFEMLAAKQFLKAGFEIDARYPTGIRGQDFDFVATRDNEVVNVEVTALRADEFSVKTMLNALLHKRKQLPDDAPAVIYCAIPEEWLAQPVNWDEVLEEIAGRFLRGTRRVNAVVFWAEQHIDFNHGVPGGALVLIRKPYLNENPRYPSNLSFLFDGKRSEPVHEAIATGTGFDQLETDSYESEFFRWIDHLLPTGGNGRK